MAPLSSRERWLKQVMVSNGEGPRYGKVCVKRLRGDGKKIPDHREISLHLLNV
jgi:hypothetical protein